MVNNPSENNKQLIVKKIDNGIVIDHISPPGRALNILKVLNINENFPHSVYVAMNVPSKKLGRKDVLKIRNIEKNNLNLNILGLLISGANLVCIENYQVVSKEKIVTPTKISHNIITCPGHSCITNLREDVETEFLVIRNGPNKESLKLRCVYCDTIFDVKDNLSLIR